MIDEQKLFILGEFYFKKGNLEKAKELFIQLVETSPSSFPFRFFLGKIEYKLGNIDSAIENLEKTRVLNPFHKQTLLLLSKAYLEKSQYEHALECMVDSYLLCKEAKDGKIETSKKKIRTLTKKLPGMDDKQKTQLIKNRLQVLHQHLQDLELTLEKKPNPEETTDPVYKTEVSSQIATIDVIEHKDNPTELIDIPGIEDPSDFDVDMEDKEFIPPQAPDNLIKPDFALHSFKDIDFTKHVLFKSLSVQEIEKISQFSTVYTYEKDEMIHHASEPIFGFSCLLEGKIGILYEGKPLLELESGSIIDEAELCNGSRYYFESRALEKTKILMVNKAALLTLCKRKHELAVHFLWHFYKSLGLKITSIMEDLMQVNPSQDMVWSMDCIREVSQQRVISELEIDFLTRKCTKTIKQKNDYLFKNHDTTNFFYILLEGEIELEHPYSKDRLAIGSGEVFSELALISNSFEHTMNAKIVSEHAVILQLNRQLLASVQDSSDRDNYRMMEFLWNIFSKKYFEFLNFYYHILKA